ncbi:MAG TPA: YjbE family putative metal transport protein [Stellaceae bacterium]|jgi:YjbE family integral membrane protein|nr:YjbE family putative metal transport protein [Stellaceae bacterium]
MLGLLNQLGALASVVIIDIVLAGDNAIVIGMAAAGLPAERRNRAIAGGVAVATVLRIGFAFLAMRLLAVIGLRLAGGILLLWVAWKLYRELSRARHARRTAEATAESPLARGKTVTRALVQIAIADLSMSLDNVIAVAGVARTQSTPWVLVAGLVLSVALMGVASSLVARLLARRMWIAWLGLAIIALVALRMIWEGSAEIIAHTAM